MIRFYLPLIFAAFLPACAIGNAGGPYTERPFERRPGQGLYQQPINLRPVAPQRIPVEDTCRSQFYRTLVGQHEGAIYFAALPGRKRVIKPAEVETLENDFLPDTLIRPPNVEIREYLPGQTLYASSIQTVYGNPALGAEDLERLTVELDDEGYVTRVECG